MPSHPATNPAIPPRESADSGEGREQVVLSAYHSQPHGVIGPAPSHALPVPTINALPSGCRDYLSM